MSNLRQSRTAALIAAGITSLAVVYTLALLLGWEEPEWAYLPRVIIHLGELAAVAALGLSGAAGGGWLAKAGLGAAGLGSLLLAAAEVLYESSPEVGDPLFGIASTLVGIGLVLAGVAVVRAGTWIGWQRYVTLTLGVYVFMTAALPADADPPGAADHPAAAEFLGEFLVQQPLGLHEQRQVDRLVRHPHLRVGGELHRQPTSDLLRGPLQLQALDDLLTQPGVQRQLRRLRASRPGPGGLLGRRRPVLLATAVTGQLAADGRRRPAEAPRDRTDRVTGSDAGGDVLPVLQAQPAHGPLASAVGPRRSARPARQPHRSSDRAADRHVSAMPVEEPDLQAIEVRAWGASLVVGVRLPSINERGVLAQ